MTVSGRYVCGCVCVCLLTVETLPVCHCVSWWGELCVFTPVGRRVVYSVVTGRACLDLCVCAWEWVRVDSHRRRVGGMGVSLWERGGV